MERILTDRSFEQNSKTVSSFFGIFSKISDPFFPLWIKIHTKKPEKTYKEHKLLARLKKLVV